MRRNAANNAGLASAPHPRQHANDLANNNLVLLAKLADFTDQLRAFIVRYGVIRILHVARGELPVAEAQPMHIHA